jgi:hypothetical protein
VPDRVDHSPQGAKDLKPLPAQQEEGTGETIMVAGRRGWLPR